jgi:hypothetical protein
MMGVHGNGLTSLIWMKPTQKSTVIEFFFPGGFAQDYEFTTRALGMVHYGFWGSQFVIQSPPFCIIANLWKSGLSPVQILPSMTTLKDFKEIQSLLMAQPSLACVTTDFLCRTNLMTDLFLNSKTGHWRSITISNIPMIHSLAFVRANSCRLNTLPA